MSTWLWIVLLLVTSLVAIVATAWWVNKRNREKVAYMMDALEDGESNFRFRNDSAMNRELNRIRDIMERQSRKNEEVSWKKLFRVITHEIMNTVTPIAALSDALTKDNQLDVKAGLKTISSSSKELIRFVESYRNFTKAVPPVFKAVMVDNLVENAIRLNKTRTQEKGVTLTYQAKTPDLLLYVDEGQIMHIFNNLIKNAIEAGATAITISAYMDKEDRTVISVSNNGQAIPLHKTEEIFVPFFTTKPQGTGVGLSLSRRIMSAHHGTLTLVQSDATQTIFAMVFA